MNNNQQGNPRGCSVLRWITILLVFLSIIGLGLYQAYQARQKAPAVSVAKAAPSAKIPTVATAPCSCLTPKPVAEKPKAKGKKKRKTKGTTTAKAKPSQKPAPVVPIAVAPVIAPAVAPSPASSPVVVAPVTPVAEPKPLLGDAVDVDYGKTKTATFISAPEKVETPKVRRVRVVVVDSTPRYYPSTNYYGGVSSWVATPYSNGPYGADLQRVVGGSTTNTPPAGSPPSGYTGGGPVGTPPSGL